MSADFICVSKSQQLCRLVGLHNTIFCSHVLDHCKSGSVVLTIGFVNPRRACAARVTVLGLCVCVSVCVSVSTYSRLTGIKPAHQRYQRL